MKTLVILFIVLGIVFLYFIASAEKSLIIKNDEVTLKGVNIPKLIINKAGEIKSRITGVGKGSQILSNGGGVIGNLTPPPTFVNDAVNSVKGFVSGIVDKAGDSIKSPIENKIQEIICPAK